LKTFRTELSAIPYDQKISHQSHILTIGSCFAQNIGMRLQNYKFNCLANPFGTIFHPIAMSHAISRAMNRAYIEASSLVHSQGVWVHPDFHSSLGHIEAEQACIQINHSLDLVHSSIKQTHFLFITFGTMIGYEWKENNRIVANCHKIPANHFTKIETNIEECRDILLTIFAQCIDLNPDLQIVLTVSPVRHIKDGIIENSRSKAKLLVLCDELVKNQKNVSYFPAYEWMVDDLRDYRFYEKDLIHPNEPAIDYIWEKFEEVYFEPGTKHLVQKIEKINKALQHKPFNENTAEHQLFLSKIQDDINALKGDYPWIQF
jgi:hypothetical protein